MLTVEVKCLACVDLLIFMFTGEERSDYYVFCKMIAYFIVHTGPSPCFFSTTMHQLIAGEPCKPTVSDVGDIAIRTQLQMVCFYIKLKYAIQIEAVSVSSFVLRGYLILAA